MQPRRSVNRWSNSRTGPSSVRSVSRATSGLWIRPGSSIWGADCTCGPGICSRSASYTSTAAPGTADESFLRSGWMNPDLRDGRSARQRGAVHLRCAGARSGGGHHVRQLPDGPDAAAGGDYAAVGVASRAWVAGRGVRRFRLAFGWQRSGLDIQLHSKTVTSDFLARPAKCLSFSGILNVLGYSCAELTL